MLEIRKATIDDLGRLMEIYRSAQDYMVRSGNPNQWGYSYPDSDIIRSDIEKGVCNVISDSGVIHGVFALFTGVDPTYLRIDGGSWLNDEPYVTIHRIAGDGKVHGIFKCAVDYCKSISSNVRIDTHKDNKTMQNLIVRSGFVKCGIIYVRDMSPRLAFQWAAN